MKKHMISFFTLLILIIIAITTFVILVKNSKEAEQETLEQNNQQISVTPTIAIKPTIAPTPTIIPETVTELYPVPQTIEDEIKYGYIDKSGEFVIAPTFNMASDFNNGVAIVTLNDKLCVIDTMGNVLFLNDSFIYDFSNGLALFADWDGAESTLYGYVNTKGEIAIEPQFTDASSFNEEGTAYVRIGSDEFAMIDITGKVLESYTLNEKYTSTWDIQDGYIIYANSDYLDYGVVNVKGEEIIPSGYSEITYLGNDLFAVKKQGLEDYTSLMLAKQAIFNSAGEQLTEYEFYDLTSFNNGYCSATDDSSTFFIGIDGKKADALPKFEGTGTLKLLGDVISADVDDELLYCSTDKTSFWKTPNSYALSDTVTVTSLKFRPLRGVLVHYPQIEGLADIAIQEQINTELYRLFVSIRNDIKAEDMLSVQDSFSAKLVKNLLIIEKTGYDYYYGAAHGMPIMSYYYIDTKTGFSYQLKDLFKEGSDYATKINEMITDEINIDYGSGESMYFPESFTGITETPFFILEEDSIIIYFYPYDIAAYAAGFPQFAIPFIDIDEYINKDSEFWKSFKEGY